jgi:ribosome modulation factor
MDFRIKPKDEADRAYAEGMEARERGLALDDCPYKEGSEMEDQWATGWYDQDAAMGDDE